jgi:predicted secreted protein
MLAGKFVGVVANRAPTKKWRDVFGIPELAVRGLENFEKVRVGEEKSAPAATRVLHTRIKTSSAFLAGSGLLRIA